MKKIGVILILIAAIAAIWFLAADYFNEKKQFEQKGTDVVATKTVASKPKSTNQPDATILKLSVAKIFGDHSQLSGLDPAKTVTIVATGDIIPSRMTNLKIVRLGNFTFPYLKTADFLKAADLTVVDLEAPLLTGCPVTSEGMSFCGDPRHIQGLKFAGVDVASIANNHIGNKGAAGIAETKKLLTDNGIAPAGQGLVATKTIKGKKFAFLAYNGVGPSFDQAQIANDIKSAKKTADVVIVMPHWGKEYVRTAEASPGIAPDDPKKVAHAMIDAGADLIIGNHPHWYQGVEIYKNKLITYAHGNFVFDQTWSDETTKGVVGKYTFYDGKLVDVNYSPIQIVGATQPNFLTGWAAAKILATMKAASWE